MIRFTCPSCKTLLQTGDAQGGVLVACPKCKSQMKVPSSSVAPPAAVVPTVSNTASTTQTGRPTAPPISSQPVEVRLRELVGKHGAGFWADARRCESMLRDICGDKTKEAHLIIQAMKQHVPGDLFGNPPGTSPSALLARLGERLEENLGLAAPAARFAVESWAFALGMVQSVTPSSTAGRHEPVTKAPSITPDSASDPGVIRGELAEWQKRYYDGLPTAPWLGERVERRLPAWKVAANGGMIEAKALLGDCYCDGVGVPQDYAQAYELSLPAADQGIPVAAFVVGVLLSQGKGGLTVDPSRAFRYFMVAAKGGCRSAYYSVGERLRVGAGTSVNMKEAAHWLKRSAEEAHDPDAMLKLADIYIEGTAGVPQDIEGARHWLEKAKEMGRSVDYRLNQIDELLDARESERKKQARLAQPPVEITLADILLEPAEFSDRRVRIRGTYGSLYTGTGRFTVEQGDHKIDVYYAQLPRDQKSVILRESEAEGRAVVVDGLLKGDDGMPDLIASRVSFVR